MGIIQNQILQGLGAIQQGVSTYKFIQSQDPEWRNKKEEELKRQDLRKKIEFREDKNNVDNLAGLKDADPSEEEIAKAGKLSTDARVLRSQAKDLGDLSLSYYKENNYDAMVNSLRRMNSYYAAAEQAVTNKKIAEARDKILKGGKK